MPRGGRRPGAGRPRKSLEEKVLGGWAGKRDTKAKRDAGATAVQAKRRSKKAGGKGASPRARARKPINLDEAQTKVWNEIAPFATALGTLTQASQLAFRDLCEAITVKRALLKQVMAEGWTIGSPGQQKAHPLLTRYQGIYQRVEAGLTKFGLSPMGEEMGFGRPPATGAETGGAAAGAENADPFAEFDDPVH